MKYLNYFLNPLLWLGVLIVVSLPFEKFFKPKVNEVNHFYGDFTMGKIFVMNIVIYALIFTLLRLTYIAVKKRFFTKLTA